MVTAGHHHDLIVFHLSVQDRDLVLRYAQTLDPAIRNRLPFGRKDGALVTFELSTTEFINLLNALAHEADTARDRTVRRSMARLHDKLGGILDKLQGARREPDAEPFRIAPPELREQLQKIVSQGPFDSIEELNKVLHATTSAYNTRPRDEFQGLSPAQVHKLLNTPWNTPGSAVHLAHDIEYAELRDAPILHNARTFLAAVVEEDGVKSTTAGNLNRKFVERMIGTMQWPEGYVEDLKRYTKVLNEEDVMSLHVLRIVLSAGGLIRHRKGAFAVTRNGKYMMQETAAGRLFALLFHVYFRRFNLSYLDRFDESPGVQHAIAYSFYVIHRLAGDWQKSEELAEKLFLPSVLKEIPPDPFGTGYADFLARHRVLEPLRQFGLIECTYLDEPVPYRHRTNEVRKMPLFDRFISFDLS